MKPRVRASAFGRRALRAFREAVADLIRERRRAGLPWVVMRKGRVVVVRPKARARTKR